MFRFKYFRQAFTASKTSKAALAVLLVGMLASAVVAGNAMQPAGAAVTTLSCSGPTTGTINVASTFSASGGNGSYHWVSAQSVADGQTYSVAFPNAGNKTVTVTSGTQTANCNIYISSTSTGGGSGAVACSGPTLLAPDQSGTWTASGGNGSYHWVSAQSVHDGPTYTVSFPNGGDKTISVTSNGQTGTCNVHVSSTLPPTTGSLTCTGPTALTVNQNGTFSVSGGTGTGYHWVSAQSTANGSSYTVSFPNTGLKVINVNDSAGNTGSCSVNVTSGTTTPPPPGPTSCVGLTHGTIATNNYTHTATVSVTNPNPSGSNCAKDAALAAYKAYVNWNGSNNNDYLNGQQLYSNTSRSIAPGQTVTMQVSLPTCNWQVDLFNGTQPKVPPFYGAELMTWAQEFNLGACTNTPPHNPTLSCSANMSSANIGQAVTYTANGGNGSYSWNTSGGSPAFGSQTSFTTAYNAAGFKTATVTSGSQTATCNVTVNQTPVNPQTVSCSPSSQSVNPNQTATFIASGGNGIFSWTGGGSPANGSGSVFASSWSTSGTRNVTVTSNGHSATCSVNVNQIVVNYPSCSPVNQNVNLNQAATFIATGGTGSYTWTGGGNPVNGSGSSFATAYGSTGSHSVTVTDGAGHSASCSVNVNSNIETNLSCSPSSQSVYTGNYASFSANGGTGNYIWNAGGASPSSGSGSNFTAQFWNQGNQTVTVSDSAGRIATCNVNVTTNVNPQAPSCSPSSQTANVNQQVTFYGNGGTGNFSWTAANGQPIYGYGSVFTTSFTTPGLYNITLNSNGQTATCSVNIQQNYVNAPTCAPSVQNANVNDFVTFAASGGNGSYFWNTSADGLPATGSGSSFGTRFTGIGNKYVTVTSNGYTTQCAVQVGGVLGASTIVTGPEDAAPIAAAIGLFGTLGAYGAIYRDRSKKLLAKVLKRVVR